MVFVAFITFTHHFYNIENSPLEKHERSLLLPGCNYTIDMHFVFESNKTAKWTICWSQSCFHIKYLFYRKKWHQARTLWLERNNIYLLYGSESDSTNDYTNSIIRYNNSNCTLLYLYAMHQIYTEENNKLFHRAEYRLKYMLQGNESGLKTKTQLFF